MSDFTGSGTTYSGILTPSGDTTYTISVAENTYTDSAGNNNSASNDFTWTLDSTSPTMTITSASVSSGDTSNDSTISLTFTSNESTTNFVEGDITLTNSSLSNFAG